MSGEPGSKKGAPGPFRADGLVPGGYWEISRGHPVQLSPAGPRHGNASVTGALPLATDPAVEEVGVDVGHKLSTDTVRAPDVSVGGVPADQSTWAKGAPPLPIEYADEGTNETDLRDKIEEYFGAGAKWVWVVRLKGERCVEVYSAPGVFTTRSGMDPIEAQGVLALPVPAAALYDRSVALDVSLRNLLRRAGYRDIDEIRQEGLAQGVAQGRAMQLRATIVDLCELLEIAIDPTRRARIADADIDALEALYAEIKRARRWPDDG